MRLFRENLPEPDEPIYPRRFDLLICDEAHILKHGRIIVMKNVHRLMAVLMVVGSISGINGCNRAERGTMPVDSSAEKHVEAVAAKLKELNPGFDGKVMHKIENGVVTELGFVADNVTDIAPVRALEGLKTLDWNPAIGGLAKLSPNPVGEMAIRPLSLMWYVPARRKRPGSFIRLSAADRGLSNAGKM